MKNIYSKSIVLILYSVQRFLKGSFLMALATETEGVLFIDITNILSFSLPISDTLRILHF
jgi:hypothetical protein